MKRKPCATRTTPAPAIPTGAWPLCPRCHRRIRHAELSVPNAKGQHMHIRCLLALIKEIPPCR